MSAGGERGGRGGSAGRGRLGALLWAVGISLAAHLLIAAAVSLEEPASTARFPDDARLALITPQNAGAEIAAWILSNDPASVFGPGLREPAGLMPEYVASFESSSPRLRDAAPPAEEISLPPLRRPGEGIGARPGRLGGAVRRAAAGVYAGRTWAPGGEERFLGGLGAEEAGRVEGAALFYRVDAAGQPGPLVVTVRGSGSAAADREGARYLGGAAPELAGRSGLYRVTVEAEQEAGR